MTAIGVGLAWISYWLGLSGYSMIRGWNNSPLALANPLHVADFTTACYTGSNVFPSGHPGDSGACASGSSGAAPVTVGSGGLPKPKAGKCPPGWTLDPATRRCFPPLAGGGPRI